MSTKNSSKHVQKIVLTAFFAAITFVFTAYLHIPTGSGYTHAGDGIIYLAASILPMPYAVAAGVIGGSLADGLSGYAVWIPATAVIKGLTALFFSNKGDNADIKKIRKLIRDTARTLEKKLTGIGGTPARCDYGHRKMQNNALKWSCGKTDIILEYVNKEYVVLHICYPVQNVPAAMTAKKDVSVKNADVSENVASNLFGDVYIENIPMVEQGNKGYCVPATVERVLRYYGINNINMHQLADAGNTRQGGGTSSREMFKGISSACRRSGLKMNSPGEVRLKMIKKYIDKGIPLFWSMYSNAEYEKLRSRNRYLRERAASPQEWAEKNKKLTVSRDGDGHMCLIIGYNELSREIAVSNSWGGAEVHPSWVPLHIAVKVSQGSTVVLMPR